MNDRITAHYAAVISAELTETTADVAPRARNVGTDTTASDRHALLGHEYDVALRAFAQRRPFPQ